ncbi:SixA phosphatase family protein [Pontibacter cellulosilyticus]|uniref:Histidine phosphatase family protein n=1 Tax=Pontibacter cellulosilyticus TaxID=1720253 RepID=A0A923N9P0_9BACT|nr:phosphoglycerate mutase family protein [Pontibacter cellulosilyticus]MBC5993452.1 histidine phosphatase family protein [Pontibacter cellulosilyticus]
MKLTLLLRVWVLLLILGTAACRNMPTGNEGAVAIANAAPDEAVTQPTTVYLVRHAEKDISNPSDQDPGLTAEGEARAEALRSELEGLKIDALYATKYKRTQNTLKPMATARNLDVQIYEAHDFNGLGQKIKEQHAGKTVVVAGHSNTILPIVEALGGKRPISDISDSQYDYLFKVAVAPDGTATVETKKFGAAVN